MLDAPSVDLVRASFEAQGWTFIGRLDARMLPSNECPWMNHGNDLLELRTEPNAELRSCGIEQFPRDCSRQRTGRSLSRNGTNSSGSWLANTTVNTRMGVSTKTTAIGGQQRLNLPHHASNAVPWSYGRTAAVVGIANIATLKD
jgi:hypothetical protein